MAAQQQYSGSIQSNPEVLEKIRHQLGLTEIGFTNALRALKMQEFSLDSSPITSTPSGKEQQGDSHLDSIAAPEAVSVDDDANHAEVAVQEALQQLPGAEASFIQHMYGLQTGVALKRKQVTQLLSLYILASCLTPDLVKFASPSGIPGG